MVLFKVKDLMNKNKMTRYQFQKLTDWNYKRINAYYFGKVISINIDEIETLCDIFNCEVQDLFVRKKS